MLQSRRPILAWLAILAVAGVAQPRPSFSQTADKGAEIPEIVVTAQHRVENVQDIPIAITALTSDTLAEHHVSSVMDLAALAPGLDIRRGDNSAVPKIFLRGVGSNDFNPTTATAVGMYQNGIYIASPLAQMGQFFDVERVEVLRGPQGTLYGRNTTGGAINIITRKPTKEFEADTSVETGNYHSLDVEGGVGGPLIRDALAARAAIRYIGDSGYMTNALTGRRGNDAGQWASRLSFLWTSGPNFTADFILNYGENHGASIWGHSRQLFPATAAATDPVTGFCAAAYFYTSQCSDALGYSNLHSNVYVGDYAFKGRDVVKAFGAGATLTWDLGDVSLISTTGLLHTTRNDLEATDDAPDGLFQSLYVQKAQTWSEELRLQNHEGGPAKWVTGLYYAHDYNSANSYYNILAPLRDPTPTNPSGCDAAVGICDFDWPNSQRVNSWAAFGQLDYTIVKDLTGTLGALFAGPEAFHLQQLSRRLHYWSLQPRRIEEV